MRDVAERAGVSLKTVSRVINEEPGVAGRDRGARGRRDRRAGLPAQRPRALAAPGALVLDARPRHRGRREPVLLGDRPGGRGRGARARLHADHRLLRGGPRARARARPARCCAAASTRCCSSPPARDHRYLAREPATGTPVVFLDRPPGGIEADTVLLDNPGGARAAVEHLLAPRATGGSPTSPTRERSTPPASASPATATALRRRGRRGRPGARAARHARRRPGRGASCAELLALPADRARPRSSPATTATRSARCARCAAASTSVALVGFDDFELADLLGDAATVVRHDSQELGRQRRRRSPSRGWTATTGRRSRIVVPTELVPRGPGRSRRSEAAASCRPTCCTTSTPAAPHRRAARARARRTTTRPRSGSARSTRRSGSRARAQPARRRHASCATRSPPTPRRTSARSTSPAAARTPACWSSCSTPASGCRCTSTPAAPSRSRARSGATTARPRPGSSSRPSPARRSTPASPRTSTSTPSAAGWTRRTPRAMLAALHELPVRAGDAIFVPAGTPHAIGEGILMVELQEPTDLSITLEWDGFGSPPRRRDLGLGWDRALQALDRPLGRRRPAGPPAGRRLARPTPTRTSARSALAGRRDRSTRASRSWSAPTGRARCGDGEPLGCGAARRARPARRRRGRARGDVTAHALPPADPPTPEGRW